MVLSRRTAITVISGLGFPLAQVAIRTFGRAGAGAVEGIAGAVLVRDVALLAGGAGRRLRRGAAAVLWTETGAALVAVVTGLPLLLDKAVRQRVAVTRPAPLEVVRRAALGTLFGMASWRLQMSQKAALTAPSAVVPPSSVGPSVPAEASAPASSLAPAA